MTQALVMVNEQGMVAACDDTLTLTDGAHIQQAHQRMVTISTRHPIVLMSLGRDHFINAPLEALLKQFAAVLHDTFYRQVTDYMNHFVTFFEELDMFDLDEENEEANYIFSIAWKRIQTLHANLQVIQQTDSRQLAQATHREEMLDYLQREQNRLTSKAYLAAFDEADYQELEETYGPRLVAMIKEEIPDQEMIEAFTPLLKDMMIQGLLKDFHSIANSIVFAGYGQGEIYPTICELHMEGRVNRKLKFSFDLHKLTRDDVRSSQIWAFGGAKQSLASFTQGVDQPFEAHILNEFQKQLDQAQGHMVDMIKAENDDPSAFNQLLTDSFADLLAGVTTDFYQYQKEHAVQPIVRNIHRQSLKQLAYHAEELLKLADIQTGLQKREVDKPLGMSVNVATIDRVDGVGMQT